MKKKKKKKNPVVAAKGNCKWSPPHPSNSLMVGPLKKSAVPLATVATPAKSTGSFSLSLSKLVQSVNACTMYMLKCFACAWML